MPNNILTWMSERGWTELYISDKVDNPTTGAGAILFSVTAPADLYMLRFTVCNDAGVPMTYVLQTYNDDTTEWEYVGDWEVPAHLTTRQDRQFAVPSGKQIRLATQSNPVATGVSLAAVEYLQAQ